MNLGIIDIAMHIPSSRQSVAEAAHELGLSGIDGRLFERFYGLKTLPYEAGGSLEALHGPLIAQLAAMAPALAASLDLVVFCHTLPSVSPLHGQGITQRLLDGLGSRAEVMDLSLAHCATALTALPLIQARLAPGRCALLLVGERGFHRVMRLLPGITIMGEASCAVVLSLSEGICNIRGVHIQHDGRFCRDSGHPKGNNEAILFANQYQSLLVAHLHSALAHFGLAPQEIALVLPHNVNLPSWKGLMRELGWPQEKVYLDNVARYSHCFGADAFINLRHAITEGRILAGDQVLLVSVGMGATLASALVKMRPSLLFHEPPWATTPNGGSQYG
jgi:3-oxoacyl-[acyl-carrier-protein] synthase III